MAIATADNPVPRIGKFAAGTAKTKPKPRKMAKKPDAKRGLINR